MKTVEFEQRPVVPANEGVQRTLSGHADVFDEVVERLVGHDCAARRLLQAFDVQVGSVRGALLRGCVDVEADLYVAGTDLPKKTAIAQLVVAIGVSFDVW